MEDDVGYLQSLSGCAIGYLVSAPQLTVDTHLGKVPLGSTLATQAQFYVEEVHQPVSTNCGELNFPRQSTIQLQGSNSVQEMTYAEALKLEENTRGQSECQLWVQERKSRLTASQFGVIVKRQKVTDKFVKLIMEPKQFRTIATAYGLTNEKKALTEYCKRTGNHIHKCGLIVNPEFPFLGASPDTKLCTKERNSGLVEVKCTAEDNC